MEYPIKKQVIFIQGSPKAGKQTYCEKLVRDYKFRLLQLKDLYEKEIQNNTSQGQKIQSILKNGQDIPSDIVCYLIIETIRQDKKSQKFLVSGFPRNLEDAIEYESNYRQEVELILNFECGQQQLVERGLLTAQSQDDIQKQVANYQQNILPMIDFYRRFGKVFQIKNDDTLERVYNHLVIPSIKPNLIFLYGAPALGKSSVAKSLAQRMNYTYFNLQEFFKSKKANDDVSKVNALIQHFSNTKDRNIIVDDFLDNTIQAKTFFQFFNNYYYVFNFNASKDVIDGNINLYNANKAVKEQLRNQYQEFLAQKKKIIEYLQQSPYYQQYYFNIEIPSTKDISLQEIEQKILSHISPDIYVANFNENIGLFNEFIQELESERGFTHVPVNSLLLKEMQRKTNLGEEICQFTNTGKVISLEVQLELIRKIIFSQPYDGNKFLITGLPNSVQDLVKFEKTVCPIKYYVHFAKQEENPKFDYFHPILTPQSYFFSLGRLITIDRNDLSLIDLYMKQNKNFGYVIGPIGVGKTSCCKKLEQRFGYKIIEFEPTIEMLKVKLGTADGPLEEVPFSGLLNYFQELVSKLTSNEVLVFDGFPVTFDLHQFAQLVNKLGEPAFVAYLRPDKITASLAYKRKNEMDTNAELGEEDNEKIDKDLARAEQMFQYMQQQSQQWQKANLFNIDISGMKLAQLQQSVEGLFFKRVITCNINMNQEHTDQHWKRYSDLLANICTHNNIIYIDVRQLIQDEYERQGPLSEKLESQFKMRWTYSHKEYPSNYTPALIVQLIKQFLSSLKYNIRDLLVFGFPSGDSFRERKLEEKIFPRVLDEINEIENNIGPIQTTLIITNQYLTTDYHDPIQEKVVKEEILQQEQPKASGEDDQEQQPQQNEDEEGGEKGPKFNPEEYSWSISDGHSKDIAQIFTKLKNSQEQRIEAHFDNLQKIGESIVRAIQLWDKGEKQINLVQILNRFD